MPLSSINTGLDSIPDLRGVGTDPNALARQLINLYNAIGILQTAIDSYTGNTPVTAANTPSSGATAGSQSVGYFTAATAIPAGRLCSINGTGQAVVADAATNIAARGISQAAAIAGGPVTLTLFGALGIYAAGSFTKGSVYYLGASGVFTLTAPAAGTIQVVGWAISDTTIFFHPDVIFH